jgi:hypothetical protein
MGRLNFCTVEFDVRRLLDNGHRDEAEALIIAKLRAGYSSPQFLSLVADLLALKKGKGKAWPRGAPRQWLEIGIRDDELRRELAEYRAKRRNAKRRRRDGNKPEPRIKTLMREFKRKDPKTIKTALAYYRIGRNEAE